ncbi:MAG: Chitinase [Clostridia bacterium]|nr:Chitinase [Clostridia bacterium]
MNKRFIKAGYVGDRSLRTVSREDANRLTHINIAFGLVKDNSVTVDHLKNLDCLEVIRNYNPNIKIILSIGGWGAGGFSIAASTEAGRETFAVSAVNIALKYRLDGLDIDWEYPCSNAAGIDCSPEDKHNFTLLLKKIREKLDIITAYDGSRTILSIAAGAGSYFVRDTEIPEITEILDFISIMTYDMAGGFGEFTGHHTNLYNPKSENSIFLFSANEAVKLFNDAGIPFEKIVLGAAFYSRRFDEVENIGTGLHQRTSKGCSFGPTYGMIIEKFKDNDGYRYYWDDTAKAPYLFNGSSFITFDDPLSIKYKCEYIKEKNLLGIMYWEHGCDNTRELLKSINTNL